MASLHTLPTELIENILVIAASSGHPKSIAALAQTCQHFQKLIYAPSDGQLWREILLSTFDDPRIRAEATGQHTAESQLDWVGQYTQRVQAATIIARLHEDSHPPTPAMLHTATRALVACMQTSLPIHPSPEGLMPLHPWAGQDAEAPRLNRHHLPLISTPSSPSLEPEQESRNMEWVRRQLADGFHRAYLGCLTSTSSDTTAFVLPLSSEEDDPFPGTKPIETQWEQTEQGKLAHKLLFWTGYHPTPSGGIPGVSEVVHLAAVLNAARQKVYRLAYLSRRRCWGPYLLADGISSEPTQVNWRHLSDSESDSDDETEYTPVASYTRNAKASPDHFEADNYGFLHPKAPNLLLQPDYNYMLAARIVVEANLRNMVPRSGHVASNDGYALDFLRVGGAPGFWRPKPEGWGMPGSDTSGEDGVAAEGSKHDLKEIPGVENVEGWDWAGVAGEWRRCVCWMDYHDLILQNTNLNVTGRDVETARIFPLKLRILGYSAPPARPAAQDTSSDPGSTSYQSPDDDLVYRLPVIHVEGESWGSDTSADDHRFVTGAVRMIGDGSVRWTLTSSYPENPKKPQWVTESVQMGGVGSGMGLLGMWTGAKHHARDPLGPCWAWKVGV